MIVDDTQWLDEPSLEAFLFAGRRLGQEGVAMLGAIRDDATRLEVPWLERQRVEPLGDDEARALLDEAVAPGVADRLVATAAGNPLALLEIPGLLSAGQLAGREPLEDPLRPGTNVERAFAAAVDALPEGSRRALLVAAAASTRRQDAIGRGLASAGLSLADLEPAEATRIVVLADGELEFRHPLLRSTVYHSAPLPGRRAAHAALAGATDSAERAWHLAACAVAPDEAVAAALEQAALEARGRGAHATAARDLGRAAQLTPEDEPRARRLLAAAGDFVRCGEAERARGLLDEAASLTGHRQMLRRGLSSSVVLLRPDLIKAYVRAGRREQAEAVLVKLGGSRWANAAGLAAAPCSLRTTRCGPRSTPRSRSTRACRYAVRARPHAARVRRAAAAGQAARRGARAVDGRARRVRGPGRAAVGRAGPYRAARDRRSGERAPRAGRGRAAHSTTAVLAPQGGAAQTVPARNGLCATPLATDDRCTTAGSPRPPHRRAVRSTAHARRPACARSAPARTALSEATSCGAFSRPPTDV